VSGAGRPLRIAFLAASLEVGGAERKMVMLAERLPRDRYLVEFVLLTHMGALGPAAQAAGCTVRVMGWPPRRSRFHWLVWPWDAVRLGLDLRRGRYDIVHAWLFHAYALAALTGPISGIPAIVAGRERLDDYKEHFGPLWRALDALARRRSDVIVPVSDAVRDDVRRHEHVDPARMRVIRNGVVIPAPMPEPERAEIRAGWGFGADELVVGCVANYKPGKGLEMLLRIAAAVRAGSPRMRLVLVGEGELRPMLQKTIRELGLAGIVRLHGSEPDARRLYGAFDMYVHASESEGGPNAVIEAAAAGLPVVATRAGGTPEAVIDGEGGLLVSVNDEEGLAGALSRMLGDPALRNSCGAAARERAIRVFSVEQYISETAALYDELAARKAVRR
jgi:glycosyltransferase involved in cell wall biosynthesis